MSLVLQNIAAGTAAHSTTAFAATTSTAADRQGAVAEISWEVPERLLAAAPPPAPLLHDVCHALGLLRHEVARRITSANPVQRTAGARKKTDGGLHGCHFGRRLLVFAVAQALAPPARSACRNASAVDKRVASATSGHVQNVKGVDRVLVVAHFAHKPTRRALRALVRNVHGNDLDDAHQDFDELVVVDLELLLKNGREMGVCCCRGWGG